MRAFAKDELTEGEIETVSSLIAAANTAIYGSAGESRFWQGWRLEAPSDTPTALTFSLGDKTLCCLMGRRAMTRIASALLLVIAALLCSASTTPEEQFGNGIAAYQRGDYVTALRILRPLADHGGPNAENALGVIYANGQGVPQDYAAAMKWYRKAANQGLAVAQANLGLMYDLGQGVPQDYAAAVKWYLRAAKQGNTYAQVYLGAMYDLGHGVPQNSAEAANWYRKAAERGNAYAQADLGAMYENGQGVSHDYVQAYKWYDLAAKGLFSADTENRDKAINSRDQVAAKMTPAQIAEAQKLVRKWKPNRP